MNIPNLEDLASPEQVAPVLRQLADSYYASHAELQASWQAPDAGKAWSLIARELERAADRIDNKILL